MLYERGSDRNPAQARRVHDSVEAREQERHEKDGREHRVPREHEMQQQRTTEGERHRAGGSARDREPEDPCVHEKAGCTGERVGNDERAESVRARPQQKNPLQRVVHLRLRIAERRHAGEVLHVPARQLSVAPEPCGEELRHRRMLVVDVGESRCGCSVEGPEVGGEKEQDSNEGDAPDDERQRPSRHWRPRFRGGAGAGAVEHRVERTGCALAAVTLLGECGFDVVGDAANSEAALARLAELQAAASVDVLFTDIELPGGMNGTELAEAAHQLYPELKVLFTTGYARETSLHERGLHERAPWLLKPYSHQELARELKALLVPTVH